ncbi:hypothetical protein J132_04791, partial [Termitomyces sp. J132]
SEVFAHGQLYVALSWCTSGDCIKVILDPENTSRKTANIFYCIKVILDPENTSRKTANIVYQEILNGLQM